MNEEKLIELINSRDIKQSYLYLPYAFAICNSQVFGANVDFKAINQAIISRWSKHGLKTIKNAAWGIVDYLRSNPTEWTFPLE